METLFLLAQNGDVAAWGIGLVVLGIVLAIAVVALWIWAMVDAIQNPALDSTMRIVWILVILFTHPIGAILYLVIGRSTTRRSTG